ADAGATADVRTSRWQGRNLRPAGAGASPSGRKLRRAGADVRAADRRQSLPTADSGSGARQLCGAGGAAGRAERRSAIDVRRDAAGPDAAARGHAPAWPKTTAG